MPSSAWDDYFEALGEYLHSVPIALAIGRPPIVPARLASRPRGPLPDAHQARLQSCATALDAMIDTAERRREDIARRLRIMRRPDRPTSRSHLIDCEL